MNDRIDFFFDLLEYLKNDGRIDDYKLDYKLKQRALSEKRKVEDFFRFVIDQPGYFSNDHKKLRQYLVDWYSTNRSMITQARNCTDPYTLSSEELNELINSLGFPYPHKIISTSAKAQFVLDLVGQYHKKGSPEVFVKTLQTYFGLSNVILNEWWIHRNSEGLYVAKSIPVYPRNLKNTDELRVEIPYDSFIVSDPLWHLTIDELDYHYNNSEISLPSITPYISFISSINALGNNLAAMSILNRKFQESYDYWRNTGDLNRDVVLSRFTENCSILELSLAFNYVFCKDTEMLDDNILFYKGEHSPLDKSSPKNDSDNTDYGLIIDEYNNLSIRPNSKDEREKFLKNRNAAFTEDPGSDNADVSNLIRNPGEALHELNPEFKRELDEYISSNSEIGVVIETLLLDLEYHLIKSMSIIDYPITYLILGFSIDRYLKDVIDFFKPYRVRVRDFLTTIEFNDPLQDSQLEKDYLFTQIFQRLESRYPRSLDNVELTIKQRFADEFLVTMYMFMELYQKNEDVLKLRDRLFVGDHMFMEEKSWWGYDYGLVKDGMIKFLEKIEFNEYVREGIGFDFVNLHDDFMCYLNSKFKIELNEIGDDFRFHDSVAFVDKSHFGLDHGLVKDNPINGIHVKPREYLNGYYDYPHITDNDPNIDISKKIKTTINIDEYRIQAIYMDFQEKSGKNFDENLIVNDQFGVEINEL